MITGLLYKDMCVEGNLIQYSHIKITLADDPLTFMISLAIFSWLILLLHFPGVNLEWIQKVVYYPHNNSCCYCTNGHMLQALVPPSSFSLLINPFFCSCIYRYYNIIPEFQECSKYHIFIICLPKALFIYGVDMQIYREHEIMVWY